jgi:DNA-binding transcriptional regulator YbjK
MLTIAGREPPELPAAEGRRAAILEATLRVIAAGGVDDVTHRRVAAEAGVPLGSTTYYFASRDDLVRDAFRHYVGKVFAFLSAIEREFHQLGTDEVVAFLVEAARREFADPDTVLIEYELIVRAARDPVLARDFNDYARALESGLAERLERLGAAQPFEAARTLIALVRGFEIHGLTRGEVDADDLRGRLRAVIGALLPAAPVAVRSRPRRRTASPGPRSRKENR